MAIWPPSPWFAVLAVCYRYLGTWKNADARLRPQLNGGGGGGGVKTSLGDSNVESSLRSSVLFKQTELFTGIATEDLSSFLLQGALPCVKPLSVPPAPTMYTQLKFLSLLRLSSFIGTLSSGGNGMLCSRVVERSHSFLPEYCLCDVQMCWCNVRTPQRPRTKEEEQLAVQQRRRSVLLSPWYAPRKMTVFLYSSPE